MIKYEPSCGEDITTTIKRSLEISFDKSSLVQFKFNGIEMVIDFVKGNLEFYSNEWQDLCDKRNQEYKDSEEYKLKEQERTHKLSCEQERLDTLVYNFHDYMGTEELLRWLIEFTECADHVGTTYNKTYVLDVLLHLGFEENMWVGYKGEWTKSHEVEYIVGQVINCIKKFGAPHPVTVTFCNKILKGEQL